MPVASPRSMETVHGSYVDPAGLAGLDHPLKVADGPGQPVEVPDKYGLHPACLHVGDEALKSRPGLPGCG